MGRLEQVLFHCPDWCDGPAFSPLVSNFWPRPVVELLADAKVQFTSNDVDLVCARFFGWCFAQPGLDTFLLSVENLSVPGGLDRAAQYQWLLAEFAGWEQPPVLVNLDTSEITRAGVVLWRSPVWRDWGNGSAGA
jgi:hypothetical protein